MPPATEGGDLGGVFEDPGLADEGFHFTSAGEGAGADGEWRRNGGDEVSECTGGHSPDFDVDSRAA